MKKVRFFIYLESIIDLEKLIENYFGESWKKYFKKKYDFLFLFSNSILSLYNIYITKFFSLEEIKNIISILFKYSDFDVKFYNKGYKIEFYCQDNIYYS